MVYQYPLSVMARTVDDVLLPSSLKYILIFMSTTCCSEYLTFIYLTCSISSNNPMRLAHLCGWFFHLSTRDNFQIKFSVFPECHRGGGGSFLEWCITSIILYNNRSYGYKRKPFQKLFQIKNPSSFRGAIFQSLEGGPSNGKNPFRKLFQIKIWFLVISLKILLWYLGRTNSLEISPTLKISKDRHSPVLATAHALWEGFILICPPSSDADFQN